MACAPGEPSPAAHIVLDPTSCRDTPNGLRPPFGPLPSHSSFSKATTIFNQVYHVRPDTPWRVILVAGLTGARDTLPSIALVVYGILPSMTQAPSGSLPKPALDCPSTGATHFLERVNYFWVPGLSAQSSYSQLLCRINAEILHMNCRCIMLKHLRLINAGSAHT